MFYLLKGEDSTGFRQIYAYCVLGPLGLGDIYITSPAFGLSMVFHEQAYTLKLNKHRNCSNPLNHSNANLIDIVP